MVEELGVSRWLLAAWVGRDAQVMTATGNQAPQPPHQGHADAHQKEQQDSPSRTCGSGECDACGHQWPGLTCGKQAQLQQARRRTLEVERLPPCPLERRRRAAQRMGLPEGAAACLPRTGCRAELTQGHPWGRCGRRVGSMVRSQMQGQSRQLRRVASKAAASRALLRPPNTSFPSYLLPARTNSRRRSS